MQEWGKGSRAIVEVEWKGREREGHVFIAEKMKHGIRFMDPQIAACSNKPQEA
ncbi:toxin glutamine deamidase domain-containing protein [Bifidobacterium cuniculi]|uniref:toxin glutamine deamidase domain-containing protein n=1 Tax=Bifidobacterium cuniculi TaxID=1688 RepID=UPI0009DFEB50